MINRVQITSQLSFSQIVYGMWRIADDADTSPNHVLAKIDACLAQGITTIDQADIYGGYTAEAVLGNALRARPSLRDSLEIVTKCDIVAPIGRYSDKPVKYYDTSAAHITASAETSLTEMGIDHIDLLLIHRPDPFMDHDETGAALDQLIASGKIKAAGVSNFRPWDFELLQSGMKNKLVTNQIELSLSAVDAFTNGDLAFHQKHRHPVMAWSPLGGGELMKDTGATGSMLDQMATEHGVDRATIATAWLLAHPANILPVMGTNNLTRIANLAQAAKVQMDRATWFQLYSAAIGSEVA